MSRFAAASACGPLVAQGVGHEAAGLDLHRVVGVEPRRLVERGERGLGPALGQLEVGEVLEAGGAVRVLGRVRGEGLARLVRAAGRHVGLRRGSCRCRGTSCPAGAAPRGARGPRGSAAARGGAGRGCSAPRCGRARRPPPSGRPRPPSRSRPGRASSGAPRCRSARRAGGSRPSRPPSPSTRAPCRCCRGCRGRSRAWRGPSRSPGRPRPPSRSRPAPPSPAGGRGGGCPRRRPSTPRPRSW